MLAKQGVSYIIITLTASEGIDAAEKAYHSLAKKQSKMLFQTLATRPLSQAVTLEQKLAGLTGVLIQSA
ncbi:MAG: hypothetical protein LBT58_00675 [Endomicrobium sp.]|jgi:hypothetical protein|nr:hypothetical protein [Endomicrobium sp.]